MSQIFISYRTKDIEIKLINQRLIRKYGEDDVFFDKEQILAGDDWAEKLETGVKDCKAFVMVVGSYWADESDKGGFKRLQNEDDWVRKEIEWAIQQNKIIIPVLLGVDGLPSKDKFPNSIQAVYPLQYLKINPALFEKEVKELLEVLEKKEIVVKVPPKEEILALINRGDIRPALSLLQERFGNDNADFNELRDDFTFQSRDFKKRDYRNRLSIYVQSLDL